MRFSLNDFCNRSIRSLRRRFLNERLSASEIDGLRHWAVQPWTVTQSISEARWRNESARELQSNPSGDGLGWLRHWLDDDSQVLSLDLPVTVDPASVISGAKAKLALVSIPQGRHRYQISDAEIQTLQIGGQSIISITNSKIGNLKILGGRSEVTLMIEQTDISELELAVEAIGECTWDGGYLSAIRGASNSAANPFAGNVTIRNVQISAQQEDADIQWLRDVRARLVERNNHRAAGVFHSVEMRRMRDTEPLANRLVSYFYQLGSDYGNSISRPLVLLAGAFSAIFLLSLITRSSVANVSEDATGWVGVLRECGWFPMVIRSAVYAAQSILNPLGLFSSKPLVNADTWWFGLLCSFLGLVGILALGLFVLSVRRRFKLE